MKNIKTIKLRKPKKLRLQKRRPQKAVVAAVLAAVFGILFLINAAVNMGKTDFWRSSGVKNNTENKLVINDAPVGEGIMENSGIYYIALTAVKEFIDPDIYYNRDEGRVILTTEETVLRLSTDGGENSVNGGSLELNFPVFNDNQNIYLPVKTVESLYDMKTSRLEKNSVFSLDDVQCPRGRLTKGARLYASSGANKYYAKLKAGAEVLVFGEEEGLLRVKCVDDDTNGGIVGYVNSECVEITPAKAQVKEKTLELPEGKINIAFDQISNAAGASLTMSGGRPEGVNVLCPTWFSFKDESGEIINKANRDYVNWAQSQGLQVWGLVTDNFDNAVSHAVISDDKKREYAIEQLAAYAKAYGLDGINVDFEAVPKDDGKYWVQFLRELVPVCHQNGLAVSCDLFVPKLWTAHYDRDSVAEIVDLVIVMGYDEHYGGSDEAGSVASLDWSVTAVEETLNAGVPKEKLVLGVPFYTRVWVEKPDGSLESTACSMDAARSELEEAGAEIVYDEETGQNYGEYTDAAGRHRCWLEDSQSIRKRAKLVNKYGIAGIAQWKLRMESAGIYGIIAEELENTEG